MTTASAMARLLLFLLATLLFTAVAALISGAAQAQTGGMMEAEDGEGSPGFPYEVADQTWPQGRPIAPLQLPASGCTGNVSYEVRSERLHKQIARPPAGIKFNEATRTLSGAPTAPLGPQTVFYIATGADGRRCGYMEIIVTIAEGETLTFASTVETQEWTLGETVTLDLPRAAAGREPISYALRSEPSGLRIATAKLNEFGPLGLVVSQRGLVFKRQAHELHGRVVAPPGAYYIELSVTDADGITGSTSFRVEIAIVDRQQMVKGAAAQRIAKIYAPVLLRDQGEKFKPVAIDAMLDHAALYQENPDNQNKSRLIQFQGVVTEADLRLHDGHDVYLDLFAGFSSTNEDEWDKVKEFYPETVYARVFTHGPQLVVQYWFFYVYNNGPGGGLGIPLGLYDDHEGDWEGIQLVFSEANTSRLLNAKGNLEVPPLPAWLGYASHNHGDLRLPRETTWRNPHGTWTAPVVYVAEGSHASYAYKVVVDEVLDFDVSDFGLRRPDKDWDIARGDHPTPLVEGSTYQLQLIRGDEQWLSWTGRWGKDHIFGPKVQGRRWTEPICWPGWRTNDANEASFAALRDC